ncbi:SDR family NAD(P)-dependent oxidoreductase [Umezawaea endophytica]|uniref:SDR family oxidoreductase n=1 Tax=Umezawaea endophytica TaxID=1654476 RepID=A0A9X2VLA7_9PSEU|nr:SDR family oxidoreductase [Umezawaea endophytica]MCS7478773.1 SDR family oxidoreductase [Umezawaea endophytica]
MGSRFDGKVVIVTGGGSGIGAAAARRFAAEGARVVVAGRTSATLDAVAGSPGDIGTRVVDVSDEAAVTELVEDVASTYGRLDVLVNNAGAAALSTVEETTTELWRHITGTNLDSVFFASRAAVKHLRVTRGNIVNVSSVAGIGGDYSAVAYNAAKGAVSNMTRAMALDHGRDGIRVNAVCPSLTVTAMTEAFRATEGVSEAFARAIPMGRAAEAEEVGDVVVFLASDDARFVTGVNLPVDGGLTASDGQPELF